MKANCMKLIAMKLGGIVALFGGYLAGHAACAHQHVDRLEVEIMSHQAGVFSYRKYCKTALGDFAKMMKDPCGLNRRLN